MKGKLLRTLLTIIPLTATPLIAASCGSKENKTKKIINPANVIKNKITTTNFDLGYQSNPAVTNPTTATAIKLALKTANPKLTDDDLSKITFSGGPLVGGRSVNVVAAVVVDKYKNTVALSIKMAVNPADVIKNKITTTSFNIAFGANKSVTNPATANALKTALKAANSSLTDDDLSKITFSGGPLVAGSATNITAIINDQGATANIRLTVTMQNQTWTQSPASKGIILQSAPVKIGSVYYVGSDGRGLYTSTNGRNWNRNNAVGIPAGADIYSAPVKIGSVYYLGTVGGGLFTSTNGRNWNRTNASGIPTNIQIYVAPVKLGNVWYLGTDGSGLYTSTDGRTWTQSAFIPNSTSIRTAPKKIGNVWYLATNRRGLYTSSNGTSWTQSPTSKGIPTNARIYAAPVKIDGNYYVGTVANGLYISTDGQTWTQNSSMPTNANIQTPPVKLDNVYYLGTLTRGLYTSSNGTSWTQSPTSKGIPTRARIYAAPVKIDDVYYLSTNANGLYTSFDGDNWSRGYAGGVPINANIYAAPVKIGNTYYLACAGQGLWTFKLSF